MTVASTTSLRRAPPVAKEKKAHSSKFARLDGESGRSVPVLTSSTRGNVNKNKEDISFLLD